jgi:beta-glucanase (GH16 family)
LPSTPTPTPNDTVVLAGSPGGITDSAGNRWTISTADTVLDNGSAAGFTANVAEIAYVNGTLWHENTADHWYSWTGSGWNAGNDPLPAQTSTPAPTPTSTPAPTPTPTAAPTPTPSPNDTVVLAASTGAITDSVGNRWTISTADTVLDNGTAAGFTANVVEIAYVSGTLWHENTADQWYSWTGSGWNAGNDPLPTQTTTPAPTPTPTPAPTPTPTLTPTPTPTSAASPNDTFVLAGLTNAITDAAGNRWTISSANAVLENGQAAGYTANIAEIAYVGGTVWSENDYNQWYSWTGSAWAPGADPLPPSGGVSATPPLNLTGYHLTFDWEGNDFNSSPIPGQAEWATTLSAYPGSQGLRTLAEGDQEYWTDPSTGQSPFKLDNGVLDINATYVGAGNTPGGGSLSYDSGIMTTQGSFSQQYGYFEMRAELPQGAGMWPAFWMLTDNSYLAGNWPPELDTLEAFGAPNANGEGGPFQAHYDVHSNNTSQQAGAWVKMNANESTSYNTYGVLWTPQTLTFYYDGQEVAQTPTPSDFTQKMYMIATVAVGGYWPGLATGENATMKIDYIRAFSSDSGIPAVPLQTVSSPDGGGYALYGATSANASVQAADFAATSPALGAAVSPQATTLPTSGSSSAVSTPTPLMNAIMVPH